MNLDEIAVDQSRTAFVINPGYRPRTSFMNWVAKQMLAETESNKAFAARYLVAGGDLYAGLADLIAEWRKHRGEVTLTPKEMHEFSSGKISRLTSTRLR